MSNICFKDNLPFIYNNMETLKEDIHQELRRLRLDKKHLYGTLLKIIDALPQEERPPVATEPERPPVATEPEPTPAEPEPTPAEPEPTPVPTATEPVTEVPVVEEVPQTPRVKKTGGRKKKVTVTV